jgi:HEAT repeat protein
LSDADLAKMKADREKARQAMEQRAKERLKPLGPDETKKLVADLESGDRLKVSAAFQQLKLKEPREPNPQIAGALERLLKGDNASVKRQASSIFEDWATRENIPTLLKLLDDDSSTIRHHALTALGRLKAPDTIDRIVQQWSMDSFAVTNALHSIGSAAETAVLQQLDNEDKNIRHEACHLLGQIGTKKSLPVLEKMKNNSDPTTKMMVQMAIDMIKNRP